MFGDEFIADAGLRHGHQLLGKAKSHLQDISSLVPWWYPHFIAGCTLLFLILLWANNRRHTGGQHSSAEPQDMEDLDVGFTCWFTDPGRRNQSVDPSNH